MGDKIEYSDLFSPDAFSKAVEGMQNINIAFKEMQSQLKENLIVQKEFFSGFKVKSYDEIQKLNKQISETNKYLLEYEKIQKAVTQTEIELAKLQQQKEKAFQQEAKSLQQLAKAYSEESKAQEAANKAAKEAESINTQKAKTETELLKQQQLRNKELREQAKEEKKAAEQAEKLLQKKQNENREYVIQTKLLNDLRNKYKDLALQEKANTKEAQDLLIQITKLDSKLKAVDASVGQFQRNVGNYTGALDTFRTGVTNILGAAGIGVGLAEGFNFLKDSVGEFSKVESSLKNLQAITGVSNKDLEFFAENAEKLGINVKGGAQAVVEAYKLIGSAKPELLENKDALNAVTESAILLSQAAGLELPDAATRLTDALNQYSASADQAGKFTDVLAAGAKFGAAEVPQVTDALLKFGVAAKSSNISIQESVGAIELLAEKGLKGAEAGTALRNVFSKLSAAKALPKDAIKELEAAGVNIEKLSDNSLSLNERLKELSKIQGDATAITRVFGLENKTAGEILISNLPRLQSLTTAVDTAGTALEQASINTDTFEQKQLRLENTLKNVKASIGEYIVNGLNDVIDGFDIATGKLTGFEYGLKKLQSTFEEQAKNIVKSNLQYEAQAVFQERALKILKDENLSLEEKNEALFVLERQINALTNELLKNKKPQQESIDATDEETDAINRNTKAVSNNTKVKKEQSTGSFEDAIRKQNEELNKDQEELDFKYAQDKKERDAKQREEDFDAALKEADRLLALEEETNKKAAEDKKKAKEDELKDLADLAQKTLQIAEKEIKAKEKLREDALNKEIEDREKNVERQRELADKGLQNTLAFEEQRLAEAERRKEDEAKKSLKREKTLAFFKLFAANAEKDPNTALQKTIVETLLADAVAGAFFKGTEKVSDDLKGNKVHNGRDGYVVAVDGSERVLTGEQNKMIGNMSNEDLAKLANDYQNGLLPKYAITDSMSTISTAQNMVNSAQLHQLVSLNKNIEDLKQTIINKKEVGIAIDNFGNVIRTEIENGVKRVEIIKNNKPRI